MGNRPFSGNRGRRFSPANRGPRRNDRIRVPEVRVIGPDGTQVGVMKTREALELAKKAGLDLVEVSPTAKPPVCRVIDFGKYKYEQSKREKDKKTTSTGSKLKEVKFRVRTDQHDYMTKLRNAEGFLLKGFKLKITLMFRGREMEHTELGFDVVRRAIADLEHIAKPDGEPRLIGRHISLTLSPLPVNRRKVKYNVDEQGNEIEPVPVADSDSDSDFDGEGDSNADLESDGDGDADLDGDGDGDGDRDGDGDSDRDIDGDVDADTEADADMEADGDRDSEADDEADDHAQS